MAKVVDEVVLKCPDLASLNSIASQALSFAGERRIWLIEGEMGAGKTTFIKAVCRLLDVADTVASPTFSIINEYHSGHGTLYHFDFYRIEKVEEAIRIGCDEYFYSGQFCFIEWFEKVESILPEKGVIISISVESDEIREFQFKKYD